MRTKSDPMTKVARVRPATAPVHGGPAAGRHHQLDHRWDQEMTRLLREAAEVREQRERARAEEDGRASRREAAALLDLVRTHDRSRA